jgi:hypothetical protein
MLGIGLHSYGFMDAAFKWLMFFNATQLVFIVVACLPLHKWKSFRHTVEKPEEPAPTKGEPSAA